MAAICVYCASAEGIDPGFVELAARVGSALAGRGHSLVSGGGRVSMMGAVATAARAGGAHTVGVIPRALVDFEVADDDADELVVVDTMRERKRIMDERSDGFLVLPGGIGTLEEMFEVWTAGTLNMHAKPVVVLDPTGHFRGLWTALDAWVATGFVRPAARATLAVTADIDEALDLVTAPALARSREIGATSTVST
jgi:uncharacterized protein (TIGR00730 family)